MSPSRTICHLQQLSVILSCHWSPLTTSYHHHPLLVILKCHLLPSMVTFNPFHPQPACHKARRSSFRTALPSQNKDPVVTTALATPVHSQKQKTAWLVEARRESLWCLAAPALEQKLSDWLLKPLPGLSRKPGGSLLSMMSKWFLSLKLCRGSSRLILPNFLAVCLRVFSEGHLDSASYLWLLLPGFHLSVYPC